MVSEADGVGGRIGNADLQGCDTARDVAELVLAVLQRGMLTTPNRDAKVYERRVQAFIDSAVT